MKKKLLFIPAVALIIFANISFSVLQNNSEINISLKSLFSINSAQAEHTSTYDCYDETYYEENNTFHTRIQKRVCTAPNCDKKYVVNQMYPDMAKCTVTYP